MTTTTGSHTKMARMKICSECPKKHYGRGYCKQHWQKARESGLLGKLNPCSFSECNSDLFAKGMCQKHYHRTRNGIPEETIYESRPAVDLGDHLGLPLGVMAQDGFALIDREYKHLELHKWYKAQNGYPTTTISGINTRLHTLIMNQAWIDHKSGDKLDNRRANLRSANHYQNQWNKAGTSSSGFKGVYRQKNGRKWNVKIFCQYTRITIGTFENIKEAAHAYNQFAEQLFGDYARLNDV